MAVELDDRGEKWAALTVAGLLLIIEDLEPKPTPLRLQVKAARLQRSILESMGMDVPALTTRLAEMEIPGE
jgi:hypothetical protein